MAGIWELLHISRGTATPHSRTTKFCLDNLHRYPRILEEVIRPLRIEFEKPGS